MEKKTQNCVNIIFKMGTSVCLGCSHAQTHTQRQTRTHSRTHRCRRNTKKMLNKFSSEKFIVIFGDEDESDVNWFLNSKHLTGISSVVFHSA